MTGGMIVGGWNFVWAAYAVTFTVLGAYTASVVLRLRTERRREQEEQR